jgi:rhodanese-related sulfurtransferase
MAERHRIPELEPAEAAAQLAGDALVLDVRENDEWEAGRIAGALHVPMAELAARQDELPIDRPIVVVCRSGGRSAAVTEALLRAGYEAKNLAGGMQAWHAAGLPIEPSEGRIV